MPFRRKHRNPLFGSSRSDHTDKENAHKEGAAVVRGAPLLQAQQLQKIPLSLPRCQSDTTQRTCSDMNPNTLKRSASQTKHRHGDISAKEDNLQLLNSTLIKEVSFLRSSNQTMAKEKEELENEVGDLATAKKEAAEKLGAAHDRIVSLELVVKNLEDVNGVLAEEASRLKEDTYLYAQEKQALLADLDKVTVEKSLLEELLESVRASGDAFHEEMQQALLQADMEKKALTAEKEALKLEKQELQLDKEKMLEDITKLGSDMTALLLQKADLVEDKAYLEREVSDLAIAKQELAKQFSCKQQALVSAQENLVEEKVRMLSEKTEVELSIRKLREDHEGAIKQLEGENHEIGDAVESLKSKVDELQKQNKTVSNERDEYLNEVSTLRNELEEARKAVTDAQKQFDLSLEALLIEKDNLVSKVNVEMDEARSCAKKCNEEAMVLTKKLDECLKQREALEATVKAATEKQNCMDKQIQTLKGDLLLADDAASEARKKSSAFEKEAAIALEKRTRETSQKIGALESKLAAMVERQGDMEAELKVKEEALRAAVRAEKEAKEKLDAAWAKRSSIGRTLQQLRAECAEIQSRAMRGTQNIESLQAEVADHDGGVADCGGGVTESGSSTTGWWAPGRRERRNRVGRNVYQAKRYQSEV